MRNARRIFMIVLGTLAVVAGVTAQDSGDPAVQINFPPPVFVLSGQAQIAGTANTVGQVNYFVEYQPIDETFAPLPGQANIWLPATLPSSAPVADGQLGMWDTTTTPDGLYAIRLTVATQSGPVFDVVAPIRVDNTSDAGDVAPVPTQSADLDTDPTVNNALLALTATAEAFNNRQSSEATPIVLTPAAPQSSTGQTAEVLVVANLRAGDSTSFDVVRALNPGTQLDVLGRSSRGTNWLFVRTPDGTEGWIAPSVVSLSGQLSDVPETSAPPAPQAAATPAAPLSAEADGNVIRVEADRQLQVGVPFQVVVTIRNDGGEFLPAAPILCIVTPQNVEVTFTGGGLRPGAQGQFVIPLRLDSGGGTDVTLECTFDPGNIIAEGNENNNTSSIVIPLAAS